jgi:hypothetical protein
MPVLRAAPPPAFGGYFDLQVIEDLLQVKNADPPGRSAPAPRISLNFK